MAIGFLRITGAAQKQRRRERAYSPYYDLPHGFRLLALVFSFGAIQKGKYCQMFHPEEISGKR
jgi:hypothetical protein